MDVFTSDEANLFTEIYGKLISCSHSLSCSLSRSLETILTKKAYSNSCLLITFYTRSDLDEVNTLSSPERQRLLEELRANEKLNQVLEHFENRVLFVDVRQEEDLEEYSVGGLRYLRYRTLNELINERKQIVYKHLDKFIEYFFPGNKSTSGSIGSFYSAWVFSLERYDCENLRSMREILSRNDALEKQLEEFRHIVSDVAEERTTTGVYDVLRFMPITNMFIDILGERRRIKDSVDHQRTAFSFQNELDAKS